MTAQGRYWILTIRESDFSPYFVSPKWLCYAKGQLEEREGGFRHWQVFFLTEKVRVSAIKSLFPTAHIELTRSQAAEEYVWKERTAQANSQFEFGSRPLKRNSKKDWDAVRANAVSGTFENIPSDIFVVLILIFQTPL